MIEFKEGDIVFVISNQGLQDKKILPNGLVTCLFHYWNNSPTLSVKALDGDSYTLYPENPTTGRLMLPLIRKATPRETFLYYISGKPFVMEEE